MLNDAPFVLEMQKSLGSPHNISLLLLLKTNNYSVKRSMPTQNGKQEIICRLIVD